MVPIITCFGEVLWDVFPTHKIVGGAPLNVALRLKSFGIDSHIISCIGKDKNGDELVKYVLDNELDVSTIQINTAFKTGAVNVTLDSNGSASYEIEYPVAWDKIEITKESIDLVKMSDAFIYGSLACRDTTSKKTLLSLIQYAKFKVFDVNLRSPHYSMSLLLELMQKADLIKCNDEELDEICKALGFESNIIHEQIKFLAKKTSTTKVCITRGGDGAILFIEGVYYTHKGYIVKVADTVGAGDSFLAALVSKLLVNTSPDEVLSFATAIGALVASSVGANPNIILNSSLNLLQK